MKVLKSSAALAIIFMVIVISSCGGRSTKDNHRGDNPAQANGQIFIFSQPADSIEKTTETESDSTGFCTETEVESDSSEFYMEVVLNEIPLTTYKRLRPENEADWIGHLMSVDLSEFSSGISDSVNIFIKFDTEVNGYTVTCRFIPFGNDTETGHAVWNFRNGTSDLILFHYKECLYHTLVMSLTGIKWRNMDTYEFNYLRPENSGTDTYPVDESHPFGYYTPVQIADIDFDGENEVMLNDLYMGRGGNNYQPYKIKGSRLVPFALFPYDRIVNITEFDFKNRVVRDITPYHADFTEYIYFSLPKEKEWRITELPELHSFSYDSSIKDSILNSKVLAIDSIKTYYFDTLFIYRRYGHSLRLTDTIPGDSPRYDTSF